MTKLTLLTHNDDITSFNAEFLEPIYQKFFNIEFYDQNKTYDKNSTLVINSLRRNTKWSEHLADYKKIVDNLYELRLGEDTPNKKYIVCKNWFWYHESLWYTHLGFNNYTIDKTYEKLALMPMRLAHPHRIFLYETIKPLLNDFIYSFVAKGIILPNDLPTSDDIFQRNFNPDWYNKTFFSLVSESKVDGNDIFVTEKTFKFMAYSHPFIVFGTCDTLKFLHSLNFETYENLFDESYDSEKNVYKRLENIIENVKNFKKVPYDKLTLEKIEHNKNLFFDKKLVEQGIIKNVIEPILEYAET